MRESFAQILQEGTEDGLTNGEQIIRTLINRAKDGDMKAIEYVLDRMGGKPLQAVEVGAEFSFNFLSEADRIRATESVERIKRMRAEGNAKRQGFDRTVALLPSASLEPRQLASEHDRFGERRRGVAPGENAANASSPKCELPPRSVRNSEMSSYGLPFEDEKQKKPRACPHGLRKDHCVICIYIGY